MKIHSTLPENYIMMLSNFKENFDIVNDPEHAFKDGTPKWLIQQWVEHITITEN